MSARFPSLIRLKVHSTSLTVPVIHGSHGEKESMMNRRSRSTLEQVEHNLILQRDLLHIQDFKHAPLSMRQVGPMVSVLYPDYLFDQCFECVLLHWQDKF